jgi:hypothetical protein
MLLWMNLHGQVYSLWSIMGCISRTNMVASWRANVYSQDIGVYIVSIHNSGDTIALEVIANINFIDIKILNLGENNVKRID